LFANEERHERTAVSIEGGNVSAAGDIAQVSPAGALKVRPTVSANPFAPVTVIVEFPREPTLMRVGRTDPDVIEKSTTLNFMEMECVRVVLVPVTVKV